MGIYWNIFLRIESDNENFRARLKPLLEDLMEKGGGDINKTVKWLTSYQRER